MKTVSSREFFHHPTTVKTLRPGQSLGVTDNGRASFIVTKAGKRPLKTKAGVDREWREISRRTGRINFTEAIRELKGR